LLVSDVRCILNFKRCALYFSTLVSQNKIIRSEKNKNKKYGSKIDKSIGRSGLFY
jgi:hypothetical protein